MDQHADHLLDQLGALREQRAAETTTDLPLPGFNGRLWATFRLPDPSKATQVGAFMAAGSRDLGNVAAELVASCTVGLFLADEEAEGPIMVDGQLSPAFDHLPGGLNDMPVNFNDERLERVRNGKLCPPRPAGRAHQPVTRVRALFGRDALMVQCAILIAGWATGGAEQVGALAGLSDRFHEGDRSE